MVEGGFKRARVPNNSKSEYLTLEQNVRGKNNVLNQYFQSHSFEINATTGNTLRRALVILSLFQQKKLKQHQKLPLCAHVA